MSRAWLSLIAVALGVMVVQLDGTVVAAANPVIAADLGAGPSGIQWVTNGYLLVLAGLIVPAGTLADRIGRKKAFLIGIGGFSAASLLCGLAPSIGSLIGARLLQAVFAALLGPAGLAVLRAAFPEAKLGRAFGTFGAVTALTTAGGPIVGGAIVEHLPWPWIFYLNLPVGVVAIITGATVIRESGQPSQPSRNGQSSQEGQSGRQPFDVPGAVLITLAMVSVVWAITSAQSAGWLSPNTFGLLALGLALLGAFVAVERRAEHPMIPLQLFRVRPFSLGIVVMALTMFSFYAVLFYVIFYLQGVQGKTPIMASVSVLPLTALFTVSSPLAGWMTERIGVRRTLVTGAGCVVAAFALLLRIGLDTGFGVLTPPLILAGLGGGLMMVPAMQAIVGSAPVEKAGAASGCQQSMQQLGGVLGIAVFGSVLSSVIGGRFGATLRAAAGSDPDVDRLADSASLKESIALGFTPDAQRGLADQLGASGLSPDRVDALVDAVTRAAHSVFVDGIHLGFTIAGGLAILAGALGLFLHQPSTDQKENQACSSRS